MGRNTRVYIIEGRGSFRFRESPPSTVKEFPWLKGKRTTSMGSTIAVLELCGIDEDLHGIFDESRRQGIEENQWIEVDEVPVFDDNGGIKAWAPLIGDMTNEGPLGVVPLLDFTIELRRCWAASFNDFPDGYRRYEMALRLCEVIKATFSSPIWVVAYDH